MQIKAVKQSIEFSAKIKSTFDHKISSDLPPAQNTKPGEKKVEFPNTYCTIVAQNDGGKIHRHFQAMNENATMEIRLLCQPIMQKARQSLNDDQKIFQSVICQTGCK